MVDERIDSSNDIEVLGSFSSGYLGFATLSLARSRRISPSSSSPHYMIVKHFSLDSFESRGSRWGVSYGALEMAHREASLLKSLQHERVVRLLASFETRSELWLVLRYHDLGSASDLLRRAFANGMPESLVAHVLRAVLQALQYLHAQHLVHRAVRAAHVLLASDGRVALSGFHACVSMVEEGSLSERLFDYPHEYAPEYLPWLAPEVLEQNQLGYDTKSDLYSLGVTACELSTAQVPFAAPPTRLMLEKVNGVKPALFRLAAPADGDKEGGAALAASSPPSRSFQWIVDALLQKDPTLRPSASDLLDPSSSQSDAAAGAELSAHASWLARFSKFEPHWVAGVKRLHELHPPAPAASTEPDVNALAEQTAACALVEPQHWDFS